MRADLLRPDHKSTSRPRPVLLLLPVALAALAAACAGQADRIDPYPIAIDLDDGPLMVTVSANDDDTVLPAVVDTLAPITILDTFTPGSPERAPRRRKIELILYSGGLEDPTPRVAFPGVSTFDLHPCTGVDAYCTIGLSEAPREARAIIGADVLARNAVRFDVPARQLSFFPDIAGDNAARARACDAVFPSPFAGGGTIALSGSEVPFSGNRIAMGACLHQDPDQQDAGLRGTDSVFVLSTGLGMSVIARSAYQRYATLVGNSSTAPPVADLPQRRLLLPSGPIDGALGSITRMALVAEGSDTRGPCQELYANYLMAQDACRANGIPVQDCPCDQALFCKTAAAIELDRSFPVLVIDDLNPLLQALRDELRPAYPEVDGILALGAIAALSLDVDYPNNRLVARCADDNGCQVRPAVRSLATLDEVAVCLPSAVDPEIN